jgi:septal ring factor EnvC (AmiA/AmiB activator)
MTSPRTDDRTASAEGREAHDASREPGGAAARWVADGHRHLMLVLSVLGADAEVVSVAPWLQNDSEQIVALGEEVQELHRRALADEHEREWLQREVDELRSRVDQLKEERERLADELTSSVNVALGRLRAGTCRSSALGV